MAYKALYRTYRPNSFEEVVGQKYIVTTLKNAIAQNKIAHAYLFCGPRGTGKTTVAKLLAKAVNCTDQKHAPCNKCESCRMIQEGTHPDVIEIDAASNNGVDEIRNLIEKVKYAPIESKYKVYIVDEVHMLTPGAFNALLKTLEEPPTHIIFVLATTEVQKVIPTIISRCQRFDFAQVSVPEISKRLEEVLKIENITYEKGVIDLISDLAAGGMRDALSILDQVIAYAQNDLKVAHVNEIYGITTPTEKYELLNYAFEGETQELLELTEHIIDNGMDIKRLTNDLIEILKECVIYDYTQHNVEMLSKIDANKANNILSKRTAKELLSMIDILIDTAEKYRFAADVNSYFEVALLKLMNHVAGDVDNKVEVVLEREHTEVRIENIVEQEPVSKPSSIDLPELNYDDMLELLVKADKQKRFEIDKTWQKIAEYDANINYIRYINKLKNCSVKAAGDGFVLVTTKYAVEAEMINEENLDEQLKAFIKELFNEELVINAITENEFKKLVEIFMQKQADNTLPKPKKKPTKIEKDSNKESKQENADDKLSSLFGEGMFDVID